MRKIDTSKKRTRNKTRKIKRTKNRKSSKSKRTRIKRTKRTKGTKRTKRTKRNKKMKGGMDAGLLDKRNNLRILNKQLFAIEKEEEIITLREQLRSNTEAREEIQNKIDKLESLRDRQGSEGTTASSYEELTERFGDMGEEIEKLNQQLGPLEIQKKKHNQEIDRLDSRIKQIIDDKVGEIYRLAGELLGPYNKSDGGTGPQGGGPQGGGTEATKNKADPLPKRAKRTKKAPSSRGSGKLGSPKRTLRGKDKNWSDMVEREKIALIILDWTPDMWEYGEGEGGRPNSEEDWNTMSIAEKEAAVTLGLEEGDNF